MRGRVKIIVAVAVLTIIVVVAPPAVRTIKIASSADGLVFLAYLSDEDFSLNPWSGDCFLVRPDTAVAILRKYEWPYERRSPVFSIGGQSPLIHQVISSRGTTAGGPFNTESDDRLFDLLEHFVGKGLSVNEYWDGFAPLHVAILGGDSEVVNFLMEHGAETDAEIRRPGRSSDGMNAAEFVSLLSEMRPDFYEEVRSLIQAGVEG